MVQPGLLRSVLGWAVRGQYVADHLCFSLALEAPGWGGCPMSFGSAYAHRDIGVLLGNSVPSPGHPWCFCSETAAP